MSLNTAPSGGVPDPAPQKPSLPPSALEELFRYWWGKSKSLIGRYWLLVSDPYAYFDKHIKGQGAGELRRTITHSFLVATAYTLFFAAIFNIQALADLYPPALQATLSKPHLFFFAIVIGALPSLAITALLRRWLRISNSDLVFVFFNLVTLYLLIVWAVILTWILTVSLIAALGLGVILWQGPPNADSNTFSMTDPRGILFFFVAMVFYAVPVFGVGAVFYYVPTMLIQRSTGRSIFVASIVCIFFGIVSLFIVEALAFNIFGAPTGRSVQWHTSPITTNNNADKATQDLEAGVKAFYAASVAEAETKVTAALKEDPQNAYAALWLDIIRARRHVPSQLAEDQKQLADAEWPAQVVQMFLGKMSPEDVEKIATSREGEEHAARDRLEKTCDAYFYAGEFALSKGAQADAARKFGLAMQTCDDSSIEKSAANEELKKLPVR
ncbi:hypothetical protein [Bradyrhizobium elkanii]|uniref:Yip1 domain-containing protein n=1 Tax=Bradyrhizobium elkanii TaxID=29448 RepID=A0ABV4FAZ3_BRAEL|nr:hypothetical protein [Bradyrhizobium elkanii]MCP1752002.1 hypothetical protein [Bradyrhizobium elkanii]MCP1977773.1 hypothetical protein [Bradyrhizobium elkanii]MCS3887710.1 hypothetical protein [Bradyrhizobium elkanii]MCS4213271.1 hypothetical protein [Bradyrhizobium elkanii]MCW2213578.1 hypothetical protein [Bradyrhizobium elkanii]